MRVEFLEDRQTFLLALLALGSLAILATAFVYPRDRLRRRLRLIRVFVIILLFIAVTSLTVVFPVSLDRRPTLYVVKDVSVSMDQTHPGFRNQLSALSDSALRAIQESCDSNGIELAPIYFAEKASDKPRETGDRRTTRISSALGLLIEKIASSSHSGPSRAILLSDGAVADEPLMDPYLTALVHRGVPVDIWDLSADLPDMPLKLFFRGPPPPMATVGDSISLLLGLTSKSESRVTITDGSVTILERRINPEQSTVEIPIALQQPGLRTISITAKSAMNSSQLTFRIKALRKLTFELTGHPSWDGRFFVVSMRRRPGLEIMGRWNRGGITEGGATRVIVAFGSLSHPIPPGMPVVFWPQGDLTGSDRGVRWIGRETGSFLLNASTDPSYARPVRSPPIPARQKVSLDLNWKVNERYADGEVFLAERVDSAAAPAYLVNAEGLWRTWMNPALSSSEEGAVPAPVYDRMMDQLILWARHATFPPVELFSLSDAGQIGAAFDILALFSLQPSPLPTLKVHLPDGSEEQIYGTGASAVRYSFVPKMAGTCRAALEGPGIKAAEITFAVSDAPFDLAHPEPRLDVLRRVAVRTGGRALKHLDSESPQKLADELLYVKGAAAASSDGLISERRVHLSQTSAFFILLTGLFTCLWILESRWLR